MKAQASSIGVSKRFLAVFLSLALVISSLPARAMAETLLLAGARADAAAEASAATLEPAVAAASDGSVTYLDEEGVAQPLSPGEFVDLSDASFPGEGELGDGWYAVTRSRRLDKRLAVTGDAKLVLCDGATATFNKGIRCAPGARLTVYAQSTDESMGTLVAKGGAWGQAGIGGDRDEAHPGSVVVRGGRVEAGGAERGAGVGGGYKGSCDVEVSGGSVTATGGEWGAGVGTGDRCGDGGRVSVSGGSVSAKGGRSAAGVGGGSSAFCDVAISGGRVTGESGGSSGFALMGGAGVGTGAEARGGNVAISGGEVTAYGREGGPAIGCGRHGGNCVITVTGGVVSANADDGYVIQSDYGDSKSPCGSVFITGGTLTLDRDTGIFGADGLIGPGGRVALGGGVRVVGRRGEALTGAERYRAVDKGSWKWARLECDARVRPGRDGVTYLDEQGVARPLSPGEFTDLSDPTAFPNAEGAELGAGWYVVSGNRAFDNRPTVTGDARLVLCDGAVADFKRGVRCAPGSRLTVYAQSTGERMGTLVAKGGAWGQAGIGGDRDEARPGSVVVRGGYVEASGAERGAGVGGGYKGSCDVEVSGGSVTARGGKWGAGVGTGDRCHDGGRVSVSGGSVSAKGGRSAAGVGGGSEGPCDVAISGGKVHAEPDSDRFDATGGSGVGTGAEARGGSVAISGGEVTAYGRAGGPAIGCGGGICVGNCDITVTGGVVNANADDGYVIQCDNNLNNLSTSPYGSVSITGGTLTLDRDTGSLGAYGLIGPGGRVTLGDDVRVVGRRGEELTGAERYCAVDEHSWSWARLEVEEGHVQDSDGRSGTWGGCAWDLSAAGELRVRPGSACHGVCELGEADRSGDLPFPWLAFAGEIASATFEADVRLPRDCSRMFDGCASLAEVNASDWDISKATDMSSMFQGCSSLASIDVSGWDVSRVTRMGRMFCGCSKLASLDLSRWDASNATDMDGMLDGLNSLARISVGERFDVSLAFPEATSADGRWLSVKDNRRYSADEVRSSRRGIADTYLSRPGGDPATDEPRTSASWFVPETCPCLVPRAVSCVVRDAGGRTLTKSSTVVALPAADPRLTASHLASLVSRACSTARVAYDEAWLLGRFGDGLCLPEGEDACEVSLGSPDGSPLEFVVVLERDRG